MRFGQKALSEKSGQLNHETGFNAERVVADEPRERRFRADNIRAACRKTLMGRQSCDTAKIQPNKRNAHQNGKLGGTESRFDRIALTVRSRNKAAGIEYQGTAT